MIRRILWCYVFLTLFLLESDAYVNRGFDQWFGLFVKRRRNDNKVVSRCFPLERRYYLLQTRESMRDDMQLFPSNTGLEGEFSVDAIWKENLLSADQISLRPNKTVLELEYDYLAPTSLAAIQALPYVKGKKKRAHVLKWWQAVYKWGLLSDTLKEIENKVKQRILQKQQQQSISNKNNNTTSTITSYNNQTTQESANFEEEFLSEMITELINLSKDHIARVIVIGDVHGCIEELCELLIKVNYLPGDQVILLGDLVAKGPYSSDVVRLAMDINALAVRGNHDQETLRQATLFLKGDTSIRMVTKHLRIAKHLSADQIKWLSTLPYYIRSKDLGVLFVHAGMEDGIPLENQLPSVMLTMRSLINQGKKGIKKPSSICYLAHPWAPSWKGPLKIYFGHDSARGFQKYNAAVGIDTGKL